MPIVRRKLEHEYRFTQIPNEWLRDSRLSLKAKGLLGQLLSHAEGWNVTIGSLAKANGCGRDSVRAAVKELEDAGYLRREQSRATGGEFAEVMWATSEPQTDSPSPDLPSSGKPASVNTTLKKTIPKEEQLVKKTIDKESEFDSFWAVYPKKKDKPRARKEFGYAIGRVEFEVLLAGAIVYRDDPNRDDQYTKHPSTWLHNDAWENGVEPEKVKKLTNAEQGAMLAAQYRAEEQGQLESGAGWGNQLRSMMKGVDDE